MELFSKLMGVPSPRPYITDYSFDLNREWLIQQYLDQISVSENGVSYCTPKELIKDKEWHTRLNKRIKELQNEQEVVREREKAIQELKQFGAWWEPEELEPIFEAMKIMDHINNYKTESIELIMEKIQT